MYKEWLRKLLADAGHGAKKDLADHLGIEPSAVSRMIKDGSDSRRIAADELPQIAAFFNVEIPRSQAEAEGRVREPVPIMGFVGAGAEIDPEFEQVPPEGLDEIDLPFDAPAEMIGFEVRGDSMMPRYDEGDIVICFREQRRSTQSLIGEEAAVRTADGRRFLKTIGRGGKKNTFSLLSFNARPIDDVVLVWVGEVWLTVRRGQYRRQQNVVQPRTTKRSATTG